MTQSRTLPWAHILATAGTLILLPTLASFWALPSRGDQVALVGESTLVPRLACVSSTSRPVQIVNILIATISSDDFKSTKMSSSIESDRGSVINALNAFEQQGDLVSAHPPRNL
jgi:hypothetical protein